MKKLIRKIYYKYVDIRNKKIMKEWDDHCFLRELCIIENRTLDLNKYSRLMKMVKRKYKK